MVDLVKIRRKAKEKKELTGRAEAAKEEPASDEQLAEEAKPARDKLDAGSETPDKPERKSTSKDRGPASPAKKAVKKDAAPVAEKKTKPEAPPEKRDVGAKTSKPAPEVVEEAIAEQEISTPAEVEDEIDEASLDRLERFKREAGKRRTWAMSAGKSAEVEDVDEVEQDLELLRFRLAGEEYAVDIEKIVEIVPPRATTRVPNANAAIVGIMSLRGTIVTVFDLRRRLGHPPIGEGDVDDRRMIVVEREGETAGFLVDKVSRVVKLDPSELESHPVVSAAEQSDYVGGVFQSTDGLVILLDLEKILASQS